MLNYTLNPDEKLIMLIRKHKIYYLKHALVILFLSILPILLYLFLALNFEDLFNPIIDTLFIIISSIYYLAILFFSLISWMNYYLDVWLVTNERIIEYEQKSPFRRETGELMLESIEDVSVKVEGIIPSIIKSGNIYVQTAGQAERFIFTDAPRPEEIKETIVKLTHQSLHQ
ncbi:MAG: PH domain-containing protein [Patescibacteria group bacterium]|jgi:hypothetical protein